MRPGKVTGCATLDALVARRSAHGVALVVAHPDDETIAAGGSLHLLPELLLIHVTDGAPRDLADATVAGFATPWAYAAARQTELSAALRVAGVTPRSVALGVPDQDASLDMAGLSRALAALFDAHGVKTVITHAYEGGHPDHDATAWAVHAAADGRRVLEFAGYHAAPDGTLRTGCFLPGPDAAEVELSPAERAQKRAMFDCFTTQASMLRSFSADTERFRPAPRYNFGTPPLPGRLNYEHWGWAMTGDRWRDLARQASQCAR